MVAYALAFLFGVFLLAVVFVGIAQTRVSPLATPAAGSATSGGATGPAEQTSLLDLARQADRPAGWAVIAVVGWLLFGGIALFEAGFFLAVVPWWLLGLVVTVAVGSGLGLGTFWLLVRENDALTYSISFLFFVLGLTAAFMVYVVAPAPASNLFLYVALFAVTVSVAHGLVSYGRSIGGGTAGAVFVVSAVLFVLILLGITARIALTG